MYVIIIFRIVLLVRSSLHALEDKMIGMHACNLVRCVNGCGHSIIIICSVLGDFPLESTVCYHYGYDIMVLSHRKSLTKVCSRFPVSIGLLCPQSDRAVGERLE